MSNLVPDKLLQTVNLTACFALLDAIVAASDLDQGADARLREAEGRLEEIIGSFVCRCGRTYALPGRVHYTTAARAYGDAFQLLIDAFTWKADTRGGASYNFWTDLSSVLVRGQVRHTHAA